ncbi:MAG: hypothetical protein IJO46_06765, partial [Thermoguttaceae bacterium]|nr:hypothetical protein [Thermoguttaceae bacterium]
MTLENGSPNNSPQWKNNASESAASARATSPKSAKKTRGEGADVWAPRRRADVPRGPAPQVGMAGGERDLNFFDILGILRRQIWIVVLMTIVGGALAVYKYTVTPKEYESSVEIYFPSASASALLRSYDHTSAANNQPKIDNIETLSTVIVSDVILEPVSDALLGKYRQDAPRFEAQFNLKVEASAKLVAESKGSDAAVEPEPQNAQAEGAENAGEAVVEDAAKKEPRRNSVAAKEERRKKAIAIGMLRKMLSVKKGGNGRDFEDANVISVSCVTLDPEEAQLIVQIVVDEFKKYFNATYNNKSEFVRKEIEKHQAA